MIQAQFIGVISLLCEFECMPLKNFICYISPDKNEFSIDGTYLNLALVDNIRFLVGDFLKILPESVKLRGITAGRQS